MELRTGKTGVNVFDRSVIKRLGKCWKPDRSGAMLETWTLQSGYMGSLAVTGAANRLLAAGSLPESMETSLLLPIGSKEETLRRIEDGIAEGARKEQVVITGAHAEVTGAVSRPVLTVSCRGKRTLCDGPVSEKTPFSGDEDIVMTGWAGLSATLLLAEWKNKELSDRFPSFFMHTALEAKEHLSIRREALLLSGEDCRRAGVSPLVMTALSDGGVYAGLWELSERTGGGLEAELPEIPILQETIEICDRFSLNPYQAHSMGSLLLVTKKGAEAVRILEDNGIPAAVIGRLRKDHDKRILNGEECQSLNRPEPDALTGMIEQGNAKYCD